METNRPHHELQQQLHEIERGENASWVVYPRTPAWWAIGFGLWAAALALTVGRLDGIVEALVLRELYEEVARAEGVAVPDDDMAPFTVVLDGATFDPAHPEHEAAREDAVPIA